MCLQLGLGRDAGSRRRGRVSFLLRGNGGSYPPCSYPFILRDCLCMPGAANGHACTHMLQKDHAAEFKGRDCIFQVLACGSSQHLSCVMTVATVQYACTKLWETVVRTEVIAEPLVCFYNDRMQDQ